jgi:RNA polymerase sigma-70 factor (ECF subfamily)
MARIAAGDRDAFRVFARRHDGQCLAMARRVLGNTSDAEEVVQEALLRVWEHAVDWRGSTSQPTTWLLRIILNLAIDRTRKVSPVFIPVEDGPAMVDPTPSAHLVLEGRELETHIAREIPGLPARQRDALSLCYFEGLSCAEAARSMNISVSAMEALLVRARRTLRGRLVAWETRRGRRKDQSVPALAEVA